MLKYADDGSYAAGMIRDEIAFLHARGAVYDASNILFDRPGIARQRGGTTTVFSGAQTAYASQPGFCYSIDNGVTTEEMYARAARTGSLFRIDKATGLGTAGFVTGAGVDTITGRPVRHFGFGIFPGYVSSGLGGPNAYLVAGAVTNATGTNATAAAQVVTGSTIVTLTGADTTTNFRVGQICKIEDATHKYSGRVTAILSATQFTVWPALSWTNAAIPIFAANAGITSSSALVAALGGACAASFQNRLLYGYTVDANGIVGATSPPIMDRRFYYSGLPTEQIVATVAALTKTHSGCETFIDVSLTPYNYIDIPGADPIIALEPISDNMLLVLTTSGAIVFSGNLVTNLTTAPPTVTWDLSPIHQAAGCLSEMSVQRTAVGIMWASAEGIFAYWPPLRRSPAHTGIRDLTDGKINTMWRDLQAGASFAIHGSAYVRGHYILTGTSGGATFALVCNVQTGAWSQFTNLDITSAVAQPSNPSRVWAIRWWDPNSAAPSMTNGQLLRLDSIFNTYSWSAAPTKVDGDGSSIVFSITTRVLVNDVETQKLLQRATVRYQMAVTGVNTVIVSAQSKVDPSNNSYPLVQLGQLGGTEFRVPTAYSVATPIVVTTAVAHGLVTGDFVDVAGVNGMVEANGRWRVSVVSGTTFQLVGSSGVNAMTLPGGYKKVAETDLQLTDLEEGQGVYFQIVSTGAVSNFELHGLRVAFYEREPVMSA